MSHAPSRTAKIAGVAALAGIMLAVAVTTLREPHEPPLEAVLPVLEDGEQQKLLARELERCATLTMPDSGCEAAWAEKRRRFFGKDSDGNRANEAIPELPGNFVADPAGSTAP